VCVEHALGLLCIVTHVCGEAAASKCVAVQYIPVHLGLEKDDWCFCHSFNQGDRSNVTPKAKQKCLRHARNMQQTCMCPTQTECAAD